MDKQERAIESTSGLLKKLVVLIVFVAVIVGFIMYLNDSEPNYKRITMNNLAAQFQKSVTNAHWQWQAEGRPPIVVVITYENTTDTEGALIEKERRPMIMSHLGWPRVEPTSEGCEKTWDMVLNLPLMVEGFKVYGEYYDGVKITGNALDSYCRFRMSVGPYFDYHVYRGDVGKVQS
ncbi:hypothetical protein OE749_13885 [Aestuariibacter sp. AA17]|uniref:Uncharacterized protein n=1 Tax=Fluctibacter corallii TaxID=2984329 RepID=A0ABT3AAT8_9ALTE|nr:hypothetical protein [Aestuariibacter sp. AA17]MCV2885783.1 hypothetical protein [Aestuariibacter sp. AA17]